MGTRADYYVGRGPEAEWLGSTTWDGNPGGVAYDAPDLFIPLDEAEYRDRVAALLETRAPDSTKADEPWPWPWEDSRTTDYAYAFEDGKVFASSFGHAWFEVDLDAENCGEPEDEDDTEGKTAIFPDMRERMGSTNHIMRKSGLITVASDSDGNAVVLTGKDWPED